MAIWQIGIGASLSKRSDITKLFSEPCVDPRNQLGSSVTFGELLELPHTRFVVFELRIETKLHYDAKRL